MIYKKYDKNKPQNKTHLVKQKISNFLNVNPNVTHEIDRASIFIMYSFNSTIFQIQKFLKKCVYKSIDKMIEKLVCI